MIYVLYFGQQKEFVTIFRKLWSKIPRNTFVIQSVQRVQRGISFVYIFICAVKYIMSVCTRSGIIWKGRKHVHVHGCNRICFTLLLSMNYVTVHMTLNIFATFLRQFCTTECTHGYLMYLDFFFLFTHRRILVHMCVRVCPYTYIFICIYTYIYRDHIHNSPRKSEGGKGKDNLIRSLATGSAAA